MKVRTISRFNSLYLIAFALTDSTVPQAYSEPVPFVDPVPDTSGIYDYGSGGGSSNGRGTGLGFGFGDGLGTDAGNGVGNGVGVGAGFGNGFGAGGRSGGVSGGVSGRDSGYDFIYRLDCGYGAGGRSGGVSGGVSGKDSGYDFIYRLDCGYGGRAYGDSTNNVAEKISHIEAELRKALSYVQFIESARFTEVDIDVLLNELRTLGRSLTL